MKFDEFLGELNINHEMMECDRMLELSVQMNGIKNEREKKGIVFLFELSTGFCFGNLYQFFTTCVYVFGVIKILISLKIKSNTNKIFCCSHPILHVIHYKL